MFHSPTTAFFHQKSPNSKKDKLSDPHHWPPLSSKNQKFRRLNSLEGDCQTTYSSDKMAAAQKVDEQMPPSAKESKWFGHYNQDPQAYQQYYWPTSARQTAHFHQQPQYQVPFNLLKSHYEVWPMMQQGQDTYVMSQPSEQGYYSAGYSLSSVSKCVSSALWGFGSAAISAMASSFTTLSYGTQSESSGLNPNAKAFKPTTLNPNAKEFKPASVKVPESEENLQDPEPVTPPNGEVSLKTVAQRKCTPWIPKPASVNVVNLEKKNQEDLKEEESEDEEEDDDEDDQDDDYSTLSTPPRSRLLSVCSSEDGFITFEDSPSSPSKVMTSIDSEKCSQFLKDFLSGNGVDSDEEESESDADVDSVADEEEEGDWDTTIEAIFLDDDEELKKLGLHSQWHVPHHIISNTSLISSDQVDHGSKMNDGHPNKDLDHQEMLKRIDEANAKWDQMQSCSTLEDKTSMVSFSEPLVTSVQEEDPELAMELRNARVDDYAQRQADQARYNRLLEPIFKPEHRDKMRSYIESYLTTS